MKYAFLAAIAVSACLTTNASAAPQTNCRPQAVRDLARLAPDGHAIYTAISDKKFFLNWITCDDVQLGLATAVHESVHFLTEEKDAFPLIGGDFIKREHALSKFYAPRAVARHFDRRSTYVETYLMPNAATSADDFLFLLDELNAYSHDLHTVTHLQTLHKGEGQVDHRDGVTALMAFVAAYVQTAKESKPETWQGLQKPEARKLVSTLWGQAETALKSSCGIPGIGRDDRKFIGFVCDAKNSSALGELLGRQPACLSTCSSPDTAAAEGTTAVR